MSNTTIGIIGGGQLGSMLSSGAKNLNIKTVVISDDKDAPAQFFADEFIFCKYDDDLKIQEFCNKVDFVTFEFENIPYSTLSKINEIKKINPKPSINKILQNRLNEKDFLNNNNIRTTSYISVKNESELKSSKDFIPGILKTCTLGYDGKGQYKINNEKELDNLKINFENNYILEKLVKLKKEISVIITRFGPQEYEIYDPIENVHEDQILKYSKIPAEINENLFNQSKECAMHIAEELGYIGSMCVEYFIDKNENLYVNEIAPRVHNSGHLTINAYNVSQFENHIRAICGLNKVETKKLYNAKMVNLIGEDILVYRNKKFKDNEFFFDYLKNTIKENRKMGHLTVIEK
jgi:5-(carboxyamino)imidazole ribonucleotide synthase